MIGSKGLGRYQAQGRDSGKRRRERERERKESTKGDKATHTPLQKQHQVFHMILSFLKLGQTP